MTKFSRFNQLQAPVELDYGQFEEFVIVDPADVSGLAAILPSRIISMLERSEQGLSVDEVVDLLTNTKPDELPARNVEWVSELVRPLMESMIASGELELTPVFISAHTKGQPKIKGDSLDIIRGQNRLKQAREVK